MSVLDKVPGAEVSPEYQFSDGDLSFINELSRPKQPMQIEERPDFQVEPGEDGGADTKPGTLDPGEDPEEGLIAAAVEETADLVTDAIDSGAAFGLSLISKNDVSVHRASADQKGRIRKIVYVYCQQTGGYVPLWLQLIILIVGIYGTQIPAAMNDRELNLAKKKNRKLEEENKKLEEQIQALELKLQNEKKAAELKAKQESIGE